ncbi:PREDICTED: uncharacterized protein LOC109339078, partial [Lupinus angustifolius]|uniref:uncharacterized protein LOC109339078 n=1 Tax=Lupinus angustifolius TaxID=3871 RepID=UPI00092F60E8
MANFQFKIITKVLADRLASIAPKIISTQQRGFIHDRKIQDCIWLASEAINLLDYKTFGGNIAIKLDIKKAFDTLDWNFLIDTLMAFGFNNQFCNCIKVILHSARLSINVNGSNVSFFKCSRCVRQASSQQINLYKCKFYTAKASPRKNADIASYLGFSPGCLPFNYLGVPLFI